MSAVPASTANHDLREILERQIAGGLIARGLPNPSLVDELLATCPPHCFKIPVARAAIDLLQGLALSTDKQLTMQELQRSFKGSGRFGPRRGLMVLAELMECGSSFMSDAFLMEEANRLAAEHRREQAAQKLARLQADLQTPFGGRPDDVVAAELAEVLDGLQGSPGTHHRPLQVNLNDFTGTRFLESYPPNYQYLLQGSLPLKSLGAIAGPPGAGKGTWSIQAAAALAAGLPVLDTWQVGQPVKVLYLSAEDSPAVVHRRLHHALKKLPHQLQAPAAKKIRAVSVSGRVSLCRQAAASGLQSTANLKDLENLLQQFRPGVVFLDTLSRFFAIPENGSDLMTEACGFLEELIQKYDCNFLVLHHVSKASGDCVEREEDLATALSQFSIRGSGALSACVRWALVLAPLGKKLAKNILGAEAGDKPAGAFVAIRVAKKNIGAPEPRFYFGRDENGLLFRTSVAENNAEADARQLAEEVRRREAAEEPRLSVSRSGQEVFSWGVSRTRKAVECGLNLGLFSKVQSGKHEHLCSDCSGCSEEAGTQGLINEII